MTAASARIGPLVFPLFATAHLLIGLAALTLVPVAPVPALCLFVVEFVTSYDNLVVAVGNRIGVNARAEQLNWARFFFHGVCIALLLPVYAGIAALAGIEFFAGRLAFALIAVLVAVIAMLGYATGFRRIELIMPINYFGCLRYAQAVGPATRRADYRYSERELAARASPPLASILTTLLGLVIALWTGLGAGVWLPFVVTALMFTAASFPIKTWGPLATSVVEVIFSAGILIALARAAGAG